MGFASHLTQSNDDSGRKKLCVFFGLIIIYFVSVLEEKVDLDSAVRRIHGEIVRHSLDDLPNSIALLSTRDAACIDEFFHKHLFCAFADLNSLLTGTGPSSPST